MSGQVRAVAVSMIRALVRNNNVLLASDLRDELMWDHRVGGPGYVPSDGTIQSAARYIRSRGIPLITSVARQHSTWMIAPPGTKAYDQWVNWILSRHYQESVSAYRALAADPKLASQKGVLYRSAMDAGFLIGKDAASINSELTAAISMEQELKDAMNGQP